ncbi:(deoxy)nucleoside triphosphate pyrophosphohydrolase [Photobacterium sanguinicancri]|uniref:5-methyl-dCTP pyrophosphohydrolase n=1 Tax=Photobacterium sanguinicancri TaxID=875932 RepID=A0ABX4FZQ4_9GAMM|nr:(deoxy)nucleoside triphosphate pyrophosphohydrolase [Photobacterium sanguinicancri]MDO6499608.1 (deoxy)nucleoside triphosphate pyrophosphohydrolase [Photobacterium sanguinicancri]OZS44070.1 5-methyl-dCTP pyrophosphohydrolase [Photobacterium sanguinicancri]
MATNEKPCITVVAGVIEKDGLYLLAQRFDSASQGGLWEFPGGKVEHNETPEQALERELIEELAIQTQTGTWLADSVFDYGDKIIELKGYISHWLSGECVLYSHQAMVWVAKSHIKEYTLCPADYPIVDALIAQA